MKSYTFITALLALTLVSCGSWGRESRIAHSYERRFQGAADPTAMAVAYADFLIQASKSSRAEGSAKLRARAKEVYRRALASEKGTLKTRLLITNNLAALLLEDDEAGEAKNLLDSIEERMKSLPEGLPAYMFNRGLAHERQGSKLESLASYFEAIHLDGSFAPASKAAFRVIRTLPPESQPQEVGKLVSLLAKESRPEAAEGFLRAGLEAADPAAQEKYLPEVVRFFSESWLRPSEIQASWRRISEWLEADVSQQATLRIDALRLVVQDSTSDLQGSTSTTGPGVLPESFQAWTTDPNDRRLFSELLRTVGGRQRVGGEDAQGAARQALALRVDPTNTEAAVDLAGVVQAEPQLGSSKTLLADLLREAPASPEGVAPADREPALRLQGLLGEIYFERGAYGPANQPGTALYHLLAATDFYRSLLATDRSTEPLPVLYEHLGDAYAASCEIYKAVVAYHEALSGYWVLGYRELAADLLSRIAQLGQTVPADWFDQWRKRLGQTIELSANEGCPGASKPAGPKPEDLKPEVPDVDSSRPEEREVYFSFDKDFFDKDALKQQGAATLNEVAALFRNSGQKIEIRIEGHTDLSGSPDYNRDLGLRRAKTVWNALRALDVPADKIWITSYGMEKHLSEENTEEEKAKDRRVVLVLRLVQ